MHEKEQYLAPRESLINKISTYRDNDKYTNKYHPEFVPGTYNIFLDKDEENSSGLKLSKNGVILHPQPTDSPNDPFNWSVWTKGYQFFLLIFITAFTAATSNDAGAVQDSMNQIYDISYASMNTGAGVLFAAIGLCTYILGPASSLYGRKITYIICITLGLIGAAWFGAAKSTTDTIWSQLFVGASEGCAEANVQLSISDMFHAHQLGWALTAYIIGTSVGTYLGPLIAGFIVEGITFRWVGWFAVIISGGLLFFLITTQYETYFDRSRYVPRELNVSDVNEIPTHEINNGEVEINIHENEKIDHINEHEISSSSETDEKNINSTDLYSHPDTNNESIDSFYILNNGSNEKRIPYMKRIALITPATNLDGWGFKQYITRLIGMLRVFWFPPVVLSGILWGLQDAFLTFYLTTEDNQYYDPPYNYSNTGVALMNIPTLIGAVIGCLYAGILSDYAVAWIARKRNGIHEAEDYLYFLIAVFIACPIGAMVFAVGTDRVWSWQVTYCVGLAFLGFSFGCSGDIAMSYLMSAYPEMVIEGMIGVSLINNSISCIFTFVCSLWLDAMGNTNTYAILTGIQVAACFSAVPFLIWGKQMRLWTRKYYLSFVETRDGVQKNTVHNLN
jgi:MFS family permease